MKVYGNGNWNRHIHRGRFNYVINFELCILDNMKHIVCGASSKINKNWYHIHIGA